MLAFYKGHYNDREIEALTEAIEAGRKKMLERCAWEYNCETCHFKTVCKDLERLIKHLKNL